MGQVGESKEEMEIRRCERSNGRRGLERDERVKVVIRELI